MMEKLPNKTTLNQAAFISLAHQLISSLEQILANLNSRLKQLFHMV